MPVFKRCECVLFDGAVLGLRQPYICEIVEVEAGYINAVNGI